MTILDILLDLIPVANLKGDTMQSKVAGILARHLTTAVGAITGADGVATGDWRIAAIGAVVTIVSMYFSYLEKKNR